MSFLKKLFGGGNDGGDTPPRVIGEEAYQGYTIRALEMVAGREYQLCGEIEKEIDGTVKVSGFIRADKLASKEQAVDVSLAKGRQIIDEQGDGLFSEGGGW